MCANRVYPNGTTKMYPNRVAFWLLAYSSFRRDPIGNYSILPVLPNVQTGHAFWYWLQECSVFHIALCRPSENLSLILESSSS